MSHVDLRDEETVRRLRRDADGSEVQPERAGPHTYEDEEALKWLGEVVAACWWVTEDERERQQSAVWLLWLKERMQVDWIQMR